jgi:hypothetical protein
MDITIQEAQTITLDDIKIEVVRDLFLQKKIIAKIADLPRPVVLWDGEEEYTAAGDWTNETATARAIAVLSLPNINWA